ncbi:MAG: transposase, partial [Alphaproteobacteria bacterium]
ERHLGLAELLAGCLRDQRDRALVTHGLARMLRFRMLAIACGYKDADDCDRHTPHLRQCDRRQISSF